MQRGARPPAEFIQGDQRRRPRNAESSVPNQPIPTNIDLRIIRKVDLKRTEDRYDWQDFVDEFAQKNHELGRTLALGGIAITYVSDTTMTHILRDRYPRDFSKAKTKQKLYRAISRNVKDFLREESSTAYHEKAQGVKMDWETRRALARDAEIDAIFSGNEYFVAPVLAEETDTALTYEERRNLEEYSYGPVTLAVRGLDLFSRRHGLDLSTNDQLYEEYYGINNALLTDGLNVVDYAGKEWRPHATIFFPHDHIAEANPIVGSMPRNISFRPIEVESHNL